VTPGTGDLLVRGIGRLLPMTDPPVEAAAVLVRDGRVSWTGREADLPAGAGDVAEYDVGGACVVPGFVDAHTHLPWAGSRRLDFEERLAGAPYEAILARGGGIHSTVAATRAASFEELVAATAARARAMLANGTTTAEVKTGYGLTPGDELRLLDVVAAVGEATGLRTEATYLGAHAVPPGRDRAAYVAEVVATIPAARARGARWCDAFCDRGAFTVEEARAVLTAAAANGLGTRLHADQLAAIGATGLAAELGCASADHLDHLTPEGAAALAKAGVVAVLLPACTLTMGTHTWDAAGHLGAAGATIALGTDCNPGTSWCESMPYVIQLACLAYGLPVAAAFRAATLGSARSMRRDDVGHLAAGAHGDLAVLDAAHEADLVAHLGARPVRATIVGGALYRPGG
jgi:imidazolonepropionase